MHAIRSETVIRNMDSTTGNVYTEGIDRCGKPQRNMLQQHAKTLQGERLHSMPCIRKPVRSLRGVSTLSTCVHIFSEG